MMTTANLATCFAPNLLRPQGEFRSAYEPLAANDCICTALENWEKIPIPKAMSLPPVLNMFVF